MAIDTSISILVVDDSIITIRITRDVLQKLGFENIHEANGGHTALEMMRKKRYGLVISDWNMDPMTGYNLLLEMRANPDLKQIPFIMATGQTTAEAVVAAKRAGADNFIVKPFSALTMKAKIDAVLSGKSNGDHKIIEI